LEPFGWSDRWAALLADAPAGATPARVLRHDGVALLVATGDGERAVSLRPNLDPVPVVGDWLALAADDRIESVLPRTSLLRRRAAGGDREQPIVANVDLVIVVCGLDRPVLAARVQRFAALAADAGAVPAIVLSKADMLDDVAPVVAALEAEVPGLDVLVVSTRPDTGIDAVRRLVAGRSVVLVGESGAGKSTLLNAIAADDLAATGAVRGSDNKGRHTTTSRHLHPLPGGGVLVDTPGVREVGLWVDEQAVADTFPEIEELAAGCRFNDCAHGREPECAVVAAVADGSLPESRLAAWRALLAEAAAIANRPSRRKRR
jgi:ribosome biogenesis GTPase / thiamine phosphate phosphatase